ncbi:unnamed protein product [Rhizoctonia solani]|uniref:Uncharacterized protein n=1 Tax=Rhizoctonia solani TaxID=456999 RepID=A0A8H3DAK7_9AGAM|nr:unnamed protein product [Rhizoctonia solani]
MLSERRPPAVNRISAFLESQRGLMSYYAAEGKSVAATWPKQSSGDSHPGSPMLVPRTAAAKDDGLRIMSGSAAPGTPVPSCPIDPDKSSITSFEKPRPANSSKSTRVVPVKSRTSQRKSIDRDQRSDDEPERLQRLEQRRNRRQARRYAMGVAESATNRGDQASETDRSRTTNKRQKTQSTDKVDKKKGKGKVTPALLLMQNFSSQSLGKSRLTIRPSPTVGVFNKGKNSGKITKNERAGRLVPDIVFSESRFLEKKSSARSDDEDTEGHSDYSDDHSAHSLTERDWQKKNRLIKANERSSHEVIVDQASLSGSPAHPPRSIREESPPWDIEETSPSSPSSARSANRSPDDPSSNSPAARKDITVRTERSVWASKLRNPGPRIPAIPDTTNSAPGSCPPKEPVQPRITSAYFAPADTPGDPQASAAPPIELDSPEDKQPDRQAIPHPIATLDPVNPPSTPECLQLEHARFLSAPENAYMRTLETPLPLHEEPPTRSLSSAANLQEDDIGWEWGSGIEPEPERGTQDYFDPEHTERISWTNRHIWDDSDIPGWENYAQPRSVFPVGEVEFHEAHCNLDCNGDEYSNDEVGYLYEDAEYSDEGMGETILYQEGDDLDYGDFGEDIFLGELDDHNPYTEAAQEREPYHPHEWSTLDDPTLEDPDLVQIDPELGGTVAVDENMEAEDEWAEQIPRLVRVITEASLQDDLIKSMSGHWNAAHRLY